ncbi:uncharacterized protein LOC130188672 isoform X2 [Pseudoliparis swirei]|uniref:uncharacterized protein LOC130188672 isoform X2 n=1 Tax=Pseudoliparis swirei TaxID=2059687 RepID=UPI0024BE965F|nr:uncharacterized protein LOC130188672 isoform X2 [Pseudoliparis swirei]
MNIYTGLTFMSFVFCISTSSECSLKNISCSDIKTDGGFTFPHECPQGSVIETLVALAGPGIPKTKLSDKKIIIGNDSVVTRNCRDLKIKCFVPVKNDTVKETCLDYKVTGMPNPDPVQPPTKENDINALTITLWVLGGPFVGASVLIVVVMVWLCCCKNKSSGVPWDLQYLRSCLINNISQTQNNGDIRLSEISATDPRGSGGSDGSGGSGGSGGSAIEHGNTLESVHSHSIDATAPQSFRLDSTTQGIQATESGLVMSDGNGASNHRAMNSLRDDPGGVNDNNRKAILETGEMLSGWTAGVRGPEDHGHEDQPLLSNQRAANRGLDMTGKPAALVHKRGVDPDRVSRRSTEPDTDVESTDEHE